jgi:hypothetical protein
MGALTWIKNAASVSTGGLSSLYLYGGLLVAGAALSTGAYLWHGWQVDGLHDAAFKAGQAEVQARWDAATTEALRVSALQTDSLQRTKDAAIKDAEKRAQDNARAAAGARTELDRLRKQAATGAGDAGTTHAACTEYATAATDVLGECASALQSLAATADGHVSDLRTFTGAWPEWDKFAQQMTEFPNRLKGNP